MCFSDIFPQDIYLIHIFQHVMSFSMHILWKKWIIPLIMVSGIVFKITSLYRFTKPRLNWKPSALISCHYILPFFLQMSSTISQYVSVVHSYAEVWSVITNMQQLHCRYKQSWSSGIDCVVFFPDVGSHDLWSEVRM